MLLLKKTLAPLWCILLSSCSIVPGISERTSAVSGRIVDAKTSRPIVDASISLHDAPKLRSTKSDANGHFLLRKTTNFHIISIYGICGPGPIDCLKDLSAKIDVEHPGYAPVQIDPTRHKAKEQPDNGIIVVEDIELTPTATNPRVNKITAAKQLWPGKFCLESQALTRP